MHDDDMGIYYPGGLRSLNTTPPLDLTSVQADDALIDDIVPDMSATDRARVLAQLDDPTFATGRPEDRALLLQAAFGAWRAEVNAQPIPELVDVSTARRVILTARLRHCLRVGALRWAFIAWIIVLFALALWLIAGCGPVDPATPGFTPAPTTTTMSPPNPLPVSDARTHPVDIPAYHREAFGKGWARVHGNCDTREAVLERDAGPAAVDTDGDGCKDDAPITDPYTGRLTAANQTDVDHVFALGDAWYAGAYKWSATQRVIFANDQSNLRAVGFSINRAKGDLGPDEWAPPSCEGRHVYATIYRATAKRWNLELTPAKDAALTRDMAPC